MPLVVPGASARRRNCGSASVFTDPLSMSIRFSLLSAKNAIDRLSGDQNGKIACSVPARAWARVVPSGRTHNCVPPSEAPGKATFHPSGEIAIDIGTVVCGVVISRRISRTKGGRRATRIAKAAARTAAAATVQARLAPRVGVTGGMLPPRAPPEPARRRSARRWRFAASSLHPSADTRAAVYESRVIRLLATASSPVRSSTPHRGCL